MAGLVCWLAATTAAGGDRWQLVEETPAALVTVDLASSQAGAGLVRFRERHVLRGAPVDPHSLRRLREILSQRVVDCDRRRIATLSRAVFADGDALIDHQATRLAQVRWQALAADDPRFRLACARS